MAPRLNRTESSEHCMRWATTHPNCPVLTHVGGLDCSRANAFDSGTISPLRVPRTPTNRRTSPEAPRFHWGWGLDLSRVGPHR
jgi:hypothetical protein